jgi:hypothetical protein
MSEPTGEEEPTATVEEIPASARRSRARLFYIIPCRLCFILPVIILEAIFNGISAFFAGVGRVAERLADGLHAMKRTIQNTFEMPQVTELEVLVRRLDSAARERLLRALRA